MRPVRAQASLTGERLFYGREKTVKDTVHFSCNIIGSARCLSSAASINVARLRISASTA